MSNKAIEKRITQLLSQMTIREKIGQLVLRQGTEVKDEQDVRKGLVGNYIGVREYNMCRLPEPLLREVHLAPFRAVVKPRRVHLSTCQGCRKN